MIHVIATIQLTPEGTEPFLDEFRKIIPLVLEEEGCIDYGPTIDLPTNIGAQSEPRPDMVIIVERWESLDALERHLIAPHMLEYRTKVKSLVVSTHLQILEPV